MMARMMAAIIDRNWHTSYQKIRTELHSLIGDDRSDGDKIPGSFVVGSSSFSLVIVTRKLGINRKNLVVDSANSVISSMNA